MLSTALAATIHSTTPQFASVKLPAHIVSTARAVAQPMRRSVASQIEYWATLGLALEHSGLSTQEAQRAIESYESDMGRVMKASKHAIEPLQPSVSTNTLNPELTISPNSNPLAALKASLLAEHGSGRLQANVQAVVQANRSKALA